MNKRLKIGLIIFGIVAIAFSVLMVLGLYSMDIEDLYGDNQDIFYRSKQGDLVVNHTTGEFGIVRKTWTRFHLIRKADTLDIYEWWDDENIEIYRPLNNVVLPGNLTYGELIELTAEKKLELIFKLR